MAGELAELEASEAVGWDANETQWSALRRCRMYRPRACFAEGCRVVYVRRGD